MQMALEWLPALQEELEHLKANGVKIGGHVSQLRHHLDAIIPGCGNRDEALTLQSLLVSYEGEATCERNSESGSATSWCGAGGGHSGGPGRRQE